MASLKGGQSENDFASEQRQFAEAHEGAKERWLYCHRKISFPSTYQGEPSLGFRSEGVPACARFLGVRADIARLRLQRLHFDGWDAATKPSRRYGAQDWSVGVIQPWLVGHIYFAQVESHPHVLKVGFSRRPRARLEDVERKHGVQLFVEPENLRAATVIDEQHWHHKLRDFHIAGEWFFEPDSTDRSLPDFLSNITEQAA